MQPASTLTQNNTYRLIFVHRALVALSDVVRTEGFMALYSGYRITIIREIPFSLIQFPLYEWLKVCTTAVARPQYLTAPARPVHRKRSGRPRAVKYTATRARCAAAPLGGSQRG